MLKENRYVLGRVDDTGTGENDCECAITWELQNGKFSMCAEIWNPRKNDTTCCGQCVEEVAALFPDDKLAARMVEVWKEWHLNDMTAGSPAQEAWLRDNAAQWEAARPHVDHYDYAVAALECARLQPDTSYTRDDKPYSYGSAWIRQELPAELIIEIKGWANMGREALDPFEIFIAANFEMKASYQGLNDDGADLYICTIKRKHNTIYRPDGKAWADKALRSEFSQGIGHRKNQMGRPFDACANHHIGFSPSKSAPSLKTALDCVISDARAYLENKDIADFCDNFGYELREGRHVHAACDLQNQKLRDMAGDLYHKLMDDGYTGQTEAA